MGTTKSAVQAYLRRFAFSIGYAIVAGVVLFIICYALREAFAAADSMPPGRARGGPGTLVLITAGVLGWFAGPLAERTWGCVGWPLMISISGTALIAGLVLWGMLSMAGLTASPLINGTWVLAVVAVIGAGGFNAYIRSAT